MDKIQVKGFRLGLAVLSGLSLLAAVLFVVSGNALIAHADPIPGGAPKLNISMKTVTPTLTHAGGETLYYVIEVRNTGAYTAAGVTLADAFPAHTTYNGDAWASAPALAVASDTLTWMGEVGFDAAVVVTFSVTVDPTFSGTVRNAAVIGHPLIATPVTVTAETIVTDDPLLTIQKTAQPARPGANKPLTYTIVVANMGQPMSGTITVTERIPLSTTVLDAGGGVTDTGGAAITWVRDVTMSLRDEEAFTFSVLVGDVPSGTVIANASYTVASEYGVAAGDLYTVTIVDPIFWLSKRVWPDPPGSNREMTYTLELLNVGSLATNLVITDRAPVGVTYVRGGAYSSGVVSWSLPRLDTGASAKLTYTVYISDVMGIPIVNDDYAVCSAEGVCQPGKVLTSVVQGPTFEAFAMLDPIAKKPGGGGGPVTPTLVVRNLGPGNAIDAAAWLQFGRISVGGNDLYAIPPIGTPPPFPAGPFCGDQCSSYVWSGDLSVGDVVTFTTHEGQSTIGGEEGTPYTATIVITDGLANMNTAPCTGTAVGKITHSANLIAAKSAPSVIGRGQTMTYTINVWNSALATDEPPYPHLWDVLPISGVTVLNDSISHGGQIQTVTLDLSGGGTLFVQAISWTLPGFGTGARLFEPRTFAVRVNDDLVSGTQIVNHNYIVGWYEVEDDEFLVNAGQSVTTTVQEVGLIHSYKEVTPALASPGPGNVLTYYLHIVNSSELQLDDVTVYDQLPWQSSTYRRDATVSAGAIVSDIVSIAWTGDVGPLSAEAITFTVLVDADYQGPVTNTATISHPSLLDEVIVEAVAYITDEPVLEITKHASPDPVGKGQALRYIICVRNLGQPATHLVITDTIPANTTIVTGSITAGGQFDAASHQVQWELDSLDAGDSRTFEFQVTVGSGREVRNELYVARCANEGDCDPAWGEPVITPIIGGGHDLYLPLVLRNV